MTITLRPHQQNALEAMQKYNKGQVIIPTGGGKTICMIEDAKRQIDADGPTTIVVVAPRILLAEQLCKEFLELIDDAAVYHVHSCLLYTSPSPRDLSTSRMPSSA